jgi:hypothetical protein
MDLVNVIPIVLNFKTLILTGHGQTLLIIIVNRQSFCNIFDRDEANRQNYELLTAKREGFALEAVDYYDLNAGTGVSTNGGMTAANSLLSYFGKLNYSLSDKYLASATIRYDGSSRFGEDNSFGWFPSGSFGWVISRESFFAGALPYISNMN